MAAEGASSAKRKMKALIWAFVVALVQRVTSQYAIGLLWVRSHFPAFLCDFAHILGLAYIYLAL